MRRRGFLLILFAAGSLLSPPVRANTITVDSLLDAVPTDAKCQLREAIIAANENVLCDGILGTAGDSFPVTGSVDVIKLSLPGTYVLNHILTNEQAAKMGDLDILESVEIDGLGAAGPGATKIDATGLMGDRIFELFATPAGTGNTLTLTRLALIKGTSTTDAADPDCSDRGGAICIRGDTVAPDRNTVNLNDVVLDGNFALQKGGAISGGLNSKIVIQGSKFSTNKTGAAGGEGGAVFSEGTELDLLGGTRIERNYADEGGAVRYNVTSPGMSNFHFNMQGVTIKGNAASTSGGGIALSAAGSAVLTATVSGSTIVSNTATNDFGGGFTGGAKGSAKIILTMMDSTISKNWAKRNVGGVGVTAFDNAEARADFRGVTVSENMVSDDEAGGLAFANGVSGKILASVVNSTIYGNSTAGMGGGAGAGGGIVLRNSGGAIGNIDLQLVSSTLFRNYAKFKAGGLYLDGDHTFAKLTNTLLVGNSAAINPECLEVPGATLASLGHNLFGDLTGCATVPAMVPTDHNSTALEVFDTTLPILANHTGPTETVALKPGPAVNAGDCTGIPPPVDDQRHVTRPQGAACDIGAFEMDMAPVIPIPPPPVTPTCNLAFVPAPAPPGSYDLTWSTPGATSAALTQGAVTLASAPPLPFSGTVNVTPAAPSTTYTLTATYPVGGCTNTVTLTPGLPPPPPPPTCNIGATAPDSDGNSDVTWTTTGATSADLTEDGNPPVPVGLSGMQNVTPDAPSSTYTVTAHNGALNAMCAVTLVPPAAPGAPSSTPPLSPLSTVPGGGEITSSGEGTTMGEGTTIPSGEPPPPPPPAGERPLNLQGGGCGCNKSGADMTPHDRFVQMYRNLAFVLGAVGFLWHAARRRVRRLCRAQSRPLR